jgi:hypothetical protein
MTKSERLKDLHPLEGRRATIKAHPATPHHSRPYEKGISLARRESQLEKFWSSVSTSDIIKG